MMWNILSKGMIRISLFISSRVSIRYRKPPFDQPTQPLYVSSGIRLHGKWSRTGLNTVRLQLKPSFERENFEKYFW